jgi:methylglyoxal synthase
VPPAANPSKAKISATIRVSAVWFIAIALAQSKSQNLSLV